MPIAQDAGGYGGTWWSRKNVEEMWEAIANQDTTSHYKLLTGWRRSFELTFEHLTQVKNYRENLAEAWPPEKSAASAAYLRRLDGLIAQLQETCDKAAANHDTFAAATLALEASRKKLKPLYDEYAANKVKLAAFAAAPPDRPVGAGKYIVQAPKPPVANGRQEELNNRARVIMYGLSDEIMTASAQIVMPARYKPAGYLNDLGEEYSGERYSAPAVPPIVSFIPDSISTDRGDRSSSSSTAVRDPEGDPPLTRPPSTERPPGLILGGVQSAATVPPGATPGVIPIPGSSTDSNVVMPCLITSPSPLGQGDRENAKFRPGIRQTEGTRPMPPGGVIGRVPGVGSGQHSSENRPIQRVNPVGGVIQPSGYSAQADAARPSSTTSSQPITNLSPSNAHRSQDSENTAHWDPDYPWQTKKGVDPVILPAPEQRIDPGPAIGL